jgi:DNA-binding transcriptional regulator LsrR (DeoR family)
MRTEAEWSEMRERYRQGVSISQIAREEGLSRITVRRYVQTDVPPAYVRLKDKERAEKRGEGEVLSVRHDSAGHDARVLVSVVLQRDLSQLHSHLAPVKNGTVHTYAR